MFNFIKKGVTVSEKDDEKEKRKREKKIRKESKQAGLSSSMSTEELLRLDEVSSAIPRVPCFLEYTHSCLEISFDRFEGP